MKVRRFYKHYMNVDHLTTSVNIVALIGETPCLIARSKKPRNRDLGYEAIIPISCEPNSPVEVRFVMAPWLRNYCERTTRERAMEIHPRLFDFLDDYKEVYGD